MSSTVDACPADEVVTAYLEGMLAAPARDRFQAHFDRCEACQSLLVALVRSPSTSKTEAPDGETAPVELTQGSAIGRYTVVAPVGVGGMGSVYVAVDPELDRDVAIKVLHRGQVSIRRRLLDEARVLARLASPNIVHVYDVGAFDDGHLFIAMELVDGVDLRAWMRRPRSWREIVAVLQQAGRGLKAAHDQKIVHRDFKPENVLVGDDGRVRVSDFGLAHQLGEAGDRTRVGTVGYASPEQVASGDVGPASDQFSYCVTFVEALCGARPRPGSGSREHLIRWPRSVPGWLRRALLRGLAPMRADRHADMASLLEVIERGMARRGPQWALTAGGGAAAFALVSGVLWGWGAADVDVCERASQEAANAYGPKLAAATRAAFEAAPSPEVAKQLAHVDAGLRKYQADLAAMYRDSCEATHHRGLQTDGMLARRVRCLDERRDQLTALARLLGEADPLVLAQAQGAIHRLSRVAECADVDLLMGPPLPEGKSAAEVERVSRLVGQAKAAYDTGRYRQALAQAQAAVAESRALGYAPLLASALLQLGKAHLDLADPKAAEAVLLEGLSLAEAHRLDVLAVQLWVAVVYTPAVERSGFERSDLWDPRALAAVARIGDDPYYLSQLHNTLGVVWSRRGDLERAAALWEKSVVEARGIESPDAFHLSLALNNLAKVASERGDVKRARELLRESLSVTERDLGARHSNAAFALANLGQLAADAREHEQAAELLRRALSVWRDSLQPDHPNLFELELMLAAVELERGRVETAAALLDAVRPRVAKDQRLDGQAKKLRELDAELARRRHAPAAAP